eukprot:3161532-Pyramimonas_sp.AAC.2
MLEETVPRAPCPHPFLRLLTSPSDAHLSRVSWPHGELHAPLTPVPIASRHANFEGALARFAAPP